MAVWLRRLIRNQMASSRASSNLTDGVVFSKRTQIRKHNTSAADVQKHSTVVVITAVRTGQSWPSG